MRLLIDLGNTRLKWAQSDANQWHTGAALYGGRDVNELLDECWGSVAPQLVAMVSVGAPETCSAIERWVAQRWQLNVQVVRAQAAQAGVVNHYREPAALGPDRWAALIGARAALPDEAVCVISCGTAITVDALSARGEFEGGVIFPGIGLQRDALLRGTAAIRVTDGNDASCLARATADAVAAGTLNAALGGIERVCAAFEELLGAPMKLVVTGGDADRIAARLSRPARRIPDLVLRGLDRIAATL